jgi:hypothetical protein
MFPAVDLPLCDGRHNLTADDLRGLAIRALTWYFMN